MTEGLTEFTGSDFRTCTLVLLSGVNLAHGRKCFSKKYSTGLETGAQLAESTSGIHDVWTASPTRDSTLSMSLQACLQPHTWEVGSGESEVQGVGAEPQFGPQGQRE